MPSRLQQLTAIDRTITFRLQGKPAQLATAMRLTSVLGGPVWTISVALLLTVMFYQGENPQFAQAFLLSIFVMGLGEFGIKLIWKRPRMDSEYVRNMRFHSYSFPSGHTLDSVVFYGLLAVYFHSQLPIAAALAVAAGCGALVLVIAYSRIYLAAHYVFDVLAGLLFGLLFLGAILLIVA